LPANQQRFRFTVGGIERRGGKDVVKVSFAERDAPTFIDFNGQDAKSIGAAWIDPTDGAVVRTMLTVNAPLPMDVSISVEFQWDKRLDLWVPSRMDERYDQGLGDLTTCSARYSNFRRFETSGRVISPE